MKFFDRREFLRTTLAGMAMGTSMLACQTESSSGLPQRPLGNTGERVSIIGLGGWDIGNIDDHNTAISIMHEAIDNGVDFFDNCWDYHDGHSEEIMGKALASGNRRDKVFLMTKVCGRDYDTARKQLEDSLRRLQTDYLDLWQFHGIKWQDDAELIYDPEQGALKAAIEARKEGKIKYIGFTGHKHPDFHNEMLKWDFEWDTVQMPVNVLDAHYDSFQAKVLPRVVERNIGAIGMKGLAAQNGLIVRKVGISAQRARRYALSLPISTLVCGIQSRENLQQDINIARNFVRLTELELEEMVEKAREFAEQGEFEPYKTGNYGCDWYHKEFESDTIDT